MSEAAKMHEILARSSPNNNKENTSSDTQAAKFYKLGVGTSPKEKHLSLLVPSQTYFMSQKKIILKENSLEISVSIWRQGVNQKMDYLVIILED